MPQPLVAALKTCGDPRVRLVDKPVDKAGNSRGITSAPTLRAIVVTPCELRTKSNKMTLIQ
jgi:hypothetical protein